MGLIGVFVIANGAIIAQMDASLEAIEASDDPSPSINIRNANLNEDAIIDFEINDAGAGYCGGATGRLSSSGGGSDFWGTYTFDGVTGEILTVTIAANGSGYSTPTISIINDACVPTTVATFTNVEVGNALYANLTNDGSTSIDVDDMWVSVDGDLPEKLYPTSYNAFGTFFPSEAIAIAFFEGGTASSVTSLSVTANGAVASFGV
jgi:archaellum component FlaF (FlaF/FlaG flagellin family)